MDANPEFANIKESEFITQFMKIVWGIPTVGKLMDAARKLENSGADAGAMADGQQQLSPAEQRFIEEQEALEQGEADYYSGEVFADEAESARNLEQQFYNMYYDGKQPEKETNTGADGGIKQSPAPIQKEDAGAIPAGLGGNRDANDAIQAGGVAPDAGQVDGVDRGNAQPLQGNVRPDHRTKKRKP